MHIRSVPAIIWRCNRRKRKERPISSRTDRKSKIRMHAKDKWESRTVEHPLVFHTDSNRHCNVRSFSHFLLLAIVTAASVTTSSVYLCFFFVRSLGWETSYLRVFVLVPRLGYQIDVILATSCISTASVDDETDWVWPVFAGKSVNKKKYILAPGTRRLRGHFFLICLILVAPCVVSQRELYLLLANRFIYF